MEKSTRIKVRPVPAIVIIPARECPFLVKELTKEAITEWVIKLTEQKHEDITYLKSVYTYWIRHSFHSETEEYWEARKIIEDIVPDVVYSIDDLFYKLES